MNFATPMRFSRRTVHTVFLIALPLVVAVFGLSVWSALGLVLIGLLWRWALTLSQFISPAETPAVVLEGIGLSHYVEKVRWCLDRLGLPYQEVQSVAALGFFFVPRTVPRLHVRSGENINVISDSPAILRYLWGAYAAEYGQQSSFLEPTAEALALEAQLDRYGIWLQQWFYHHLLPSPRLTLHVWGANDLALPRWQRLTLVATFPILRVLARQGLELSPGSNERPVQRIEGLLGELENRLADGRRTLTGVADIGFVDITLAALSGLWLFPAEYGAGKAETVRLTESEYPEGMASDIDNWRAQFPRVVAFVEQLYTQDRLRASVSTSDALPT